MREEKILVTGADGQLGYYVCRELQLRNIPCFGFSSKDLDVMNEGRVQARLREIHPTAVIHCAAWTAVDLAERMPEESQRVNEQGTGNVASACKAIDAKLLYLSTDYVFSGEKQAAYETEDAAKPLNQYGYGKLRGEVLVREQLEHFFIVRTSWLYSERGHNFVKTMMELYKTHETLRVVSDQIGSPTYAPELAKVLCDLIKTDRYGTYHATGEGTCSWAEFAQEIARLAGASTKILPVTSAEYGALACRPHNSVLSKTSLDAAGISRMPDWQDSLKRCVAFIQQDNER